MITTIKITYPTMTGKHNDPNKLFVLFMAIMITYPTRTDYHNDPIQLNRNKSCQNVNDLLTVMSPQLNYSIFGHRLNYPLLAFASLNVKAITHPHFLLNHHHHH